MDIQSNSFSTSFKNFVAVNFTLFIPCILYSYLSKCFQQCVQSTLNAAGIWTGFVQILELLYVFCAYFWESLDTFLVLFVKQV